MINSNVISGVHDLLEEHGARQEPNERFGEFVARALSVSPQQAEILLEELSKGATPSEASVRAELDPDYIDPNLLTRLARAVGSALGKVAREL